MRAYASPVLVEDVRLPSQSLRRLERKPFAERAAFDEAWLQNLIHDHPELLPIAEIEPAMVPVVAICKELGLPSGYVDNLLLTPTGDIVVVEAKLWRNPQARREVVSQILDYAKDLSGFSFDRLEAAVRTAREDVNTRLVDLVRMLDPQVDEASFVDAVSRNLRRGRFLLLIAGDGIQESAEQLAEFLQRHVSLQFTLSLVELAVWSLPGDRAVLVQPRILARTVQIERAVIRSDAGPSAPQARITPASPEATPLSLTEEAFFEGLARISPSLPDRLREFLKLLEPLGIVADVKRGLTLKWKASDGRMFNVGFITADGRLETDYVNWQAQSIGRLDLAHRYQSDMARLVAGASVRQTEKPTGWRVAIAGKSPSVEPFLANTPGWIGAIQNYTSALEEVVERA
jgi:hypothetical protein